MVPVFRDFTSAVRGAVSGVRDLRTEWKEFEGTFEGKALKELNDFFIDRVNPAKAVQYWKDVFSAVSTGVKAVASALTDPRNDPYNIRKKEPSFGYPKEDMSFLKNKDSFFVPGKEW